VAPLLPMAAHAECTQRDLQGGWVAMVGFDGTGAWSRCDLRIASTGCSTGSCLLPNGGWRPYPRFTAMKQPPKARLPSSTETRPMIPRMPAWIWAEEVVTPFCLWPLSRISGTSALL
jgi:hypothetical protein